MHGSNFTLSPKRTRLALLHVSKASLALSPAEVETHGKWSQGVSQAEHESLFFLWIGFQLHLSLDPACLLSRDTSISPRNVWLGAESPLAAAQAAV